MIFLKNRKVKRARKDHECGAFVWIDCVLSEIRNGEIKMTFAERRSIVKAIQHRGMVLKGEPCLYQVSIYDGDFGATYAIPEMAAICNKYDLYDND